MPNLLANYFAFAHLSLVPPDPPLLLTFQPAQRAPGFHELILQELQVSLAGAQLRLEVTLFELQLLLHGGVNLAV